MSFCGHQIRVRRLLEAEKRCSDSNHVPLHSYHGNRTTLTLNADDIPARNLIRARHGEESLSLQHSIPRLYPSARPHGNRPFPRLDLGAQLAAGLAVRVAVPGGPAEPAAVGRQRAAATVLPLVVDLVRREDAGVPARRRADVQVELVPELDAEAGALFHGALLEHGLRRRLRVNVQQQLLEEEAAQAAARDHLGVAVVEPLPRTAHVLPVDALGTRRDADDLGVGHGAAARGVGGVQGDAARLCAAARCHDDARQHLAPRVRRREVVGQLPELGENEGRDAISKHLRYKPRVCV